MRPYCPLISNSLVIGDILTTQVKASFFPGIMAEYGLELPTFGAGSLSLFSCFAFFFGTPREKTDHPGVIPFIMNWLALPTNFPEEPSAFYPCSFQGKIISN